MAAISVELLFTSRGARDSFDNRRTYTRVYEVITDDPLDDEDVVGNADVNGEHVPLPGESLGPKDPFAVVVDLDFQQSDDDPTIWYVTVEYDSDPPRPDEFRADRPVDFDGNPIDPTSSSGKPSGSPTLEPVQWKLTTQDSEEPAIEGILVNEAGILQIVDPPAWAATTAYKRGAYVKNGGNVYLCVLAGTSAGAGGPAGMGVGIVDGTARWDFYATHAQTQTDPNKAIRTAVRNSAKLPFDPPLMTEVSRAVLSITKNMPLETATLAYILELKNAVNLLEWRGVPPRCAKVLKVEHDGGKERNGVLFVATHWEIGLDFDTWDLRALDAGYGRLADRTNPGPPPFQETKYFRFTDVYGEPLDEPVPLNGHGQPLNPDDPPVFIRFVPRQMRIIDFNTKLPF
jgi:hypothetical protein